MPWIPTKFPAPDGRRASKSPCANQYVPRRPSPPHPQPCGTTRNAITTSAKRHRHTVSNTNAKRGRPRGRGLAALQISCPDHRSSSATILENRSPWRRWLAEWATSMRPRESEGSRRRTTMTKGKSGAGAPDRYRGRPLRKPPPPGATYEEKTNAIPSPLFGINQIPQPQRQPRPISNHKKANNHHPHERH